jgi:hypothetical protein
MEVSGTIRAGESAAAMGAIKARRGLSPRQARWIVIALIVIIGIPSDAWITHSWSKGAACVEVIVITTFCAGLIVQALTTPTLRKALAARGQAFEQAMTLRLTPDAVSWDLGDLTMTATWPCVTDVYRTKQYWVFLVQSSAMILPRRFFATPQAEALFIAEAASRLTPAARARSPDAVQTAGSSH